ncbi:hypothetical protein [Hymenobacter sp. UYCo722]|uniref:terminase small subunit-like protein n=1 Tax=Hymenobacter sp. UYCo722 TaxID=3156335 RepID=UPI0033967C5E
MSNPINKAGTAKKTVVPAFLMDSFDELYDQPKPKSAVGRPTIYTDELADTIIGLLNDGKGLRFISAQPGMPAITTIIRWRAEHSQFKQLYARAREAQLELMSEDILDISDNGPNEVGRDKLRVDSRKWLLSKLNRHVYGNTVKVELEKPEVSDLDLTKFSAEQLDSYISLQEIAKRDDAE